MIIHVTMQEPGSGVVHDHLDRLEHAGEQVHDVRPSRAVRPSQECLTVEVGRVHVHFRAHADQVPGGEGVATGDQAFQTAVESSVDG